MYKAGVLIDDHGLPPSEVHSLGRALNLQTSLALGRFKEIGMNLGVLLSRPLALEEDKILQLKDLFICADKVLWEGRTPWTPYCDTCGVPGLISFNLEQRLRRNEEEVENSAALLQRIRSRNQ